MKNKLLRGPLRGVVDCRSRCTICSVSAGDGDGVVAGYTSGESRVKCFIHSNRSLVPRAETGTDVTRR